MNSIPFIVDIRAQRERLGARLTQAIDAVLDHGQFINGPEVGRFETALAAFCGANHVVGCANGTDALTLVCMAEGLGAGDAVFVPSFTFVATAEAPAQVGATPVFVDVDARTFNMSADSLQRAIGESRQRGLNPRMVIAVDLYGQPADYPALGAIARKHDMVLVADAAQAMGASLNGNRTGTLADYTTTSFFPTKPLGCFGDGGAVLTDDADKAARVRSIAGHGHGVHKYDHVRFGLNSRLDTLQAAILLEKMNIFEDELATRRQLAARYSATLAQVVAVPALIKGAETAWALYTVQTNGRSGLKARLERAGIPSAVYYPKPLHQQSAYRHFPADPAGLPISDEVCQQVLSLPLHPYLSEQAVDEVIAAITT